jgi:hypothetical protein
MMYAKKKKEQEEGMHGEDEGEGPIRSLKTSEHKVMSRCVRTSMEVGIRNCTNPLWVSI